MSIEQVKSREFTTKVSVFNLSRGVVAVNECWLDGTEV